MIKSFEDWTETTGLSWVYRKGFLACWSPHEHTCLLYTSDAADERSSVDLGGRRIIKKKKKNNSERPRHS